MIRWREPSRAGGALFDWDFTQQSPGALVLPAGLTFARASSGHTVQTGTSTLTTTGITSDNVARVGKLADAHSYGIFIEPARTNSCRYSRSMNLAPGALSGSVTYTTGRTSPDGTTNAIRGQIGSGAYANYDTVPSPGTFASNTRMTLSAWVKQGSGSGAYQFNAAHAGTTGAAAGGTAGANWSRVASASFVYPSGTACYPVGWDGRANTTIASSAGARDCEIDFVQIEAGGYATSAIITSGGSTATRAAERLTINSAVTSPVVRQGRLGCYLRFRAIAGLTSMSSSAEGNLLFGVGTTCSVWISASSRYIYMDAGGAQYSQTANSVINWSAGDLVEVQLELGNGKSKFRWRINGGATNTASFTTQDDTLGAVSLASGLDVLSSGTNWHTPGVLEKVVLYLPGRSVF
jgi:hypothetical protein